MGYKESTHDVVMELYKKYGATESIKIAAEMLHSREQGNNKEFRIEMHGEVCESVLEIMLLEYMKNKGVHPTSYYIGKSWVLRNRDRLNSNFLTEIDLTLFTRECIYVFECKSYTGDKHLVSDGTIVREGKQGYDVYKQNKMHKDVLEPWVEPFTLPGKIPVIQMCLFQFSNGTVFDERSKAQKSAMPCLTVYTLFDYLNTYKEAVWDMKSLNVIGAKFDEISDKLRDQHLAYVKSLHGK